MVPAKASRTAGMRIPARMGVRSTRWLDVVTCAVNDVVACAVNDVVTCTVNDVEEGLVSDGDEAGNEAAVGTEKGREDCGPVGGDTSGAPGHGLVLGFCLQNSLLAL
jgi:hypothetical protein